MYSNHSCRDRELEVKMDMDDCLCILMYYSILRKMSRTNAALYPKIPSKDVCFSAFFRAAVFESVIFSYWRYILVHRNNIYNTMEKRKEYELRTPYWFPIKILCVFGSAKYLHLHLLSICVLKYDIPVPTHDFWWLAGRHIQQSVQFYV